MSRSRLTPSFCLRRIELQADGDRTTPWKLTWWFTRPRDPKGTKWGGSGNVSRAAVRTHWPEGNPPLKGGEVTRAMSSSYLRLPIEIKQHAKDRGTCLDKYSISMHVRFESIPKGKETTAVLAALEDSKLNKAAAFVFLDAKGNVRFSDGTVLFGTLADVRVHVKPMHWYVISIAVDASIGNAHVWINGKPHCTAQSMPQIKPQGMHSMTGTMCIFGSSEKKEMHGIKLITMLTLQLNVLDDEKAKAVFDGGPEGFMANKDQLAGCVGLARLHSAVGYAEAERRIAQLIDDFAELKRFTRSEVVHALTTVYKPAGKLFVEETTQGVKLMADTAKESMIGCRVEVDLDGPRAKGTGTLIGFQFNGIYHGDRDLRLGFTNGFCRVDFKEGNPASVDGRGGWNLKADKVTVFPKKPSAPDPSTFRAATTADGEPSRDFEVGGFVKHVLRDDDEHDHLMRGRVRRSFRPPPHLRGPTRDKGGSTPAQPGVDPDAIFVVTKLTVSEVVAAAIGDMALGGGTSKSDFVVVKPIDPDAGEPKLIEADSFAEDLAEVLAQADEKDATTLLARFGIYLKQEMVVMVSNKTQEVGDISVAMSSLRERADSVSSEVEVGVTQRGAMDGAAAQLVPAQVEGADAEASGDSDCEESDM
jgi:hypothetical protein